MKLVLLAMWAGLLANAHAAAPCIKDGDSTTDRKACCSRYTVPNLTYGSLMVCGSRPITDAACIGPGGVDDTLTWSNCCSGGAVPGSTHCLNPADFGTTWRSCFHICS